MKAKERVQEISKKLQPRKNGSLKVTSVQSLTVILDENGLESTVCIGKVFFARRKTDADQIKATAKNNSVERAVPSETPLKIARGEGEYVVEKIYGLSGPRSDKRCTVQWDRAAPKDDTVVPAHHIFKHSIT